MSEREEKRINIAEDLMKHFDIKWCNKYPKKRFYVFDKESNKYVENKILLEREILDRWLNSRIEDRSAIFSYIAMRVKVDDIKDLNKEEE